jgi:hypothetical protein
MASFYSAWFIGSIVLPEQAFTVNGVLVVVAAGTYYLSDPTAGLSLLAAVRAAMLPQAAGATAVLLGSGKVRLAAAGAFSITWGAATLLRDLLGFAVGLAASSSYTAPSKSDLYFSPGKPALFALSPLGVDGQDRYILSQSVSAYSGRAESTSHGSRVFQRFTFEKVDSERLRSPSAAGGEFGNWFALVAVRSARWKLYRDAVEDAAATTAFTFDTVHGPYILPLGRSAEWDYKRSSGHTWTDYTCDLAVDAHVCPEIE